MGVKVGIWCCPVCGEIATLKLPSAYFPNTICRCQSRNEVYNYMRPANHTAREFDKATRQYAASLSDDDD